MKEKQVTVDKIYITGDFRDASCQEGTDSAASDIAKYILKLADIVDVKKSRDILLVPGNHDLTRDYEQRQDIIRKIKEEYNPANGTLKGLDILVDSFEFYKKVVAHIAGNEYADNLLENVYKINPHFFIITDDVNILQLNTELLAGEVIVDREGRKRVLD